MPPKGWQGWNAWWRTGWLGKRSPNSATAPPSAARSAPEPWLIRVDGAAFGQAFEAASRRLREHFEPFRELPPQSAKALTLGILRRMKDCGHRRLAVEPAASRPLVIER